MEYILMSIRARYAALILSGRKTLEIRKTAPKGLRECAEITVLLYESKREGGRGAIVGSFVCRSIRPVTMREVREVCRRACLSRGIQNPVMPPPRDGRYTRRQIARLATDDARLQDAAYWARRYPGWELTEATASYNEFLGWAISLKMRRRKEKGERAP